MTALTTKQLEQERKSKANTETKASGTGPETIDIRARQSEIEREAEEAKATVREVERKERRGRELPYKPQRTQGTAKLVIDIEKSRKEAQTKGKVVTKAIGKVVAEHDKKIKAIAKYKSGDGYDLVAMIQDGYTKTQLTKLGFANEAITKAQARVDEVAKADKYKSDTGYDLVAMVSAGYTESQLESLFGKDAAQAGVARASAVDKAAKYKTDTGYDVAAMVRDNFSDADMKLLFDTDTITHAGEIVKADKYKTETGYDLLAMFDDGYTQGKATDLGFDADDVREVWKYHLALDALAPYEKGKDGEGRTIYDLVAISKAVDKGQISPELITLVLGENPAQYLTVAQVHQLRLATEGQAYMMGDAWGVSKEQVNQIRAAPTDVAAKVYAYLQETAPEAIELTHPSQLPSFQQTPDWKELASALQDIEPYKTGGNDYDVGKAYQDMIAGKLSKQSFIVAFGDDTYRDTKAFYDTNVEIKPGTWVAKAEWKGLTPDQQSEVITTGQYTPIASGIGKDGKAIFANLQSTGDIHPLAQYQGYDEETGEVSYLAPDTNLSMDEIMKYWDEMNEGQKQIQINGALGKNVRAKYKDFEDLTEDEKKQVLRYYAKSYLGIQTKGTEQYFKDAWQEEKTQLKEAGLGMIPIYGTIRNWDSMSPTWRGISIALDVACVLPFIVAGVRAIRGAVAPLRTQATVLAKAELATSKNMAKTLAKTYNNRALGRAYTNMAKAQSSYTRALARVAQLRVKGKAVPLSAQRAVSRAELTLRTRATTFVSKLNLANSSIKGTKNIPVRFDSAEVKALMRSLPNEMVQNSKAAISALEIRPQNIRTLTRAVANAESKLKAAQARHPTDPSKWVDLMYDLNTAQGKLAQAKTGSVTTLYQELLKARSAGKTAKAAKLERDLAQAIKSMEVEWGRMGFHTGGNVAVAVETKPFWPSTGISPAAIEAATATKGLTGIQSGIVAVIINAGVVEKTTGVTTPDVVRAAREIATATPKTKGTTTPEVIALTQKIVETSLKDAAEGKTQAEIRADVISQVEPILRSMLDTKTITQPQFKTLLNTTTKVATRLATPIKTRAKPKPILKMPKVDKDKDGRPIYPEGTVVFKMGKTKRGAEYKAMLPPYNQPKLVSSRKPPVGMKRTEGTPEQTLTVIGDKKLPFGNLSADIGITDVFVDTRRKKIRFAPGLRTNVGQRIPSNTRGVSLSRNEMVVTRQGPIFFSRLKGQRGFSMSRHNPRRRRGRKI